MDLDRLKSHINIYDIVSQYVSLEESGDTMYRGLCPFHSETKPSFTVYTDTCSFYCFGCGVGGDVIKFLMELEDISFKDAVEHLKETFRA